MNAIETQGLTRRFDDRLAVDQLTLEVPRGTVFGLLGPNGAGKTTTIRMLTALIAPSAGTATIAGHRLGVEDDAIRRSIGILTETPGLYDKLSAMQNLVFFARLYGLTPARAAERTEHYLRLLGLWDRRHDAVGGFSKGMRQKVAIARAILHEPPLVFLDEPTAGLDPEASRTVREFVRQLRAGGRTIVLTTHNLPEADELCDLIALFRTRLLRVDTPANLRAGLFGRGTRIRLEGNPAAWIDVVRALPFVSGASIEGEAIEVQLDDPEARNPALVRALVEAGARIRYVEPRTWSLEKVYLELVHGEEKSYTEALL